MKKYNDEQCFEIINTYIDTVEERITYTQAENRILAIAKDFPIHNLSGHLRRVRKYLSGKGEYGQRYPANWAMAFLKATNNNPLVIKALKEQEALYLEKDGKCNGKLKELLENL